MSRCRLLHLRQMQARQLRIDTDSVLLMYAIHKYGRWFAWVCFL